MIPNASSTLTETNTRLSRTTQSNADGIFVFPDLPIGTYTLRVGASGFTTGNSPALTLLTGQVIDLPVRLAVGSQSQEVTVSSESQSIETTTSSSQQSVTVEQIQNLPLNGRNPLQLTTLTPGTVLTTVGTESGQEDNTGLSVNGLRATEDTYVLDGAIYVNRFFDSGADSAQSRRSAGVHHPVVQLRRVSRRRWRARAALHTLWNLSITRFSLGVSAATPCSTRATTFRPQCPYKLNQFGGTVGGPIFRSKRAFFFFSAEDLQQRSSPNPIAIELPTAAELGGDFSALAAKGTALYNPATGQPYAGDIITTPMDALSAAVNKQYLASAEAAAVLSSDSTYSTFQSTSNSNIDNTQYLVRLDDQLTDRDHLSGHYFYNQDNFQRAFNAPLGFFAANLFRNQSLTISEAHTFSNRLTGIVNASAFRSGRTQIPETPGLQTLQALGMNAPFGNPNESLVPFPGVRDNISGYVDIFSGGALTQDPTSFSFNAQAVKLLRRHTADGGRRI